MITTLIGTLDVCLNSIYELIAERMTHLSTGVTSGAGTTDPIGIHPGFYCGSCCSIIIFLCSVL